jgi:hypothetical protein
MDGKIASIIVGKMGKSGDAIECAYRIGLTIGRHVALFVPKARFTVFQIVNYSKTIL